MATTYPTTGPRRSVRDGRPGIRMLSVLGLVATVAWTTPAAAGQVEVFGHIVTVSTFNAVAGRPRLDGNEIVEFTFAVDRVISHQGVQEVGKVLTMHLPLEQAATREDVARLHVGERTYLTVTTGSPVRHFRFHATPEGPAKTGVSR